MKKIVDFFIARKRELALFILIVIAAALSGINLGLLLVIILFFGGLGVIGKSNPERLLHILEAIIVIVAISSYFVAKFPRSNSKVPYARAALDQNFSSAMPDRTQVEATDLWDTSKDSQREKFLAEYRQTLKAGDTKKAYELLEKFQSKWDMKEVAASMKAMKDSIAGSKEASFNNPTQPNKTDTEKVGGIFPIGEYTLALKQGEESDWCTIENCRAYSFSKSATARVTLTYEDGTMANSWDPGKWPNKYKFKVRNLNKEMPVLQVM